MNADQKRIEELLAHPSESLNVEIKNWINPDDKAAQAKIVRATLALRNRNGGYLIIGFDDKTGLPDPKNRPSDIHSTFHTDKIQGLISKYASVTFEAAVVLGQRDGQLYPVIAIPEGVRSPVAAKADLVDGTNRLIRTGDVYFRTLAANGTPSSALARHQDWPDIVEICFENREADIGRFLRRQLGSNRDVASFLTTLREFGFPELTASSQAVTPAPALSDLSVAVLDAGEKRLKGALANRKLNPEEQKVIEAGSWSVGLVIDPPRLGRLPDQVFRSTLASSNPQYTGWPVWLDSSGFVD
jgi:hypothetical protein